MSRNTALEQVAWDYLVMANQVLRMIREAEKRELTSAERHDLDVATRSAKRVLAVALNDLGMPQNAVTKARLNGN